MCKCTHSFYANDNFPYTLKLIFFTKLYLGMNSVSIIILPIFLQQHSIPLNGCLIIYLINSTLM